MSAERKPKVRIVPFRDGNHNLRYRWQLVVNGQVVATDHRQGYDRRHRAREMAERVVGGDYADYELDDPGADALGDDG